MVLLAMHVQLNIKPCRVLTISEMNPLFSTVSVTTLTCYPSSPRASWFIYQHQSFHSYVILEWYYMLWFFLKRKKVMGQYIFFQNSRPHKWFSAYRCNIVLFKKTLVYEIGNERVQIYRVHVSEKFLKH